MSSQPCSRSMNSRSAVLVIPPEKGTGSPCCHVWPPSLVARTTSWSGWVGAPVDSVNQAWSASKMHEPRPALVRFEGVGGETSCHVLPPSVVRVMFCQPTLAEYIWKPDVAQVPDAVLRTRTGIERWTYW